MDDRSRRALQLHGEAEFDAAFAADAEVVGERSCVALEELEEGALPLRQALDGGDIP